MEASGQLHTLAALPGGKDSRYSFDILVSWKFRWQNSSTVSTWKNVWAAIRIGKPRNCVTGFSSTMTGVAHVLHVCYNWQFLWNMARALSLVMVCFRVLKNRSYTVSRCISVNIVIGYWLEDRDAIPGRDISLFATTSVPTLGPTQTPILWVSGSLHQG
jgi:hypothetical protein